MPVSFHIYRSEYEYENEYENEYETVDPIVP